MKRAVVAALAGIAVLGLPAAMPAQPGAPADPEAACRLLIERSPMTDEGQQLLRRLMRSQEAPALMDRLVHLASGVGGGDVAAGLSRLIDAAERAQQRGTGAAPAPVPPVPVPPAPTQ